jgi:hypothetical protein
VGGKPRFVGTIVTIAAWLHGEVSVDFVCMARGFRLQQYYHEIKITDLQTSVAQIPGLMVPRAVPEFTNEVIE